jgi:hypothetical protein
MVYRPAASMHLRGHIIVVELVAVGGLYLLVLRLIGKINVADLISPKVQPRAEA